MKNKFNDIPYGGLDADKIQKAEPILNLTNFKLLYEYINERYKIHLRKDVNMEQAPWTDNPVLRYYKFTNVRREHDRTTLYLIDKLEEHKSEPLQNIYGNIVLFRLFNKMETYELLGGWVDFVGLESGKVEGKTIHRALKSAPDDYVYFTNAFYTTGMRRGMKQYYGNGFEPTGLVKTVAAYSSRLSKDIDGSEQPLDVIKAIEKLSGLGKFLSYQMFVDMTYLTDFPWSENEFTMAGSGCVRGLKEIYVNWDGLNAEELLFHLRDTIDENFRLLVDPDWDVKKLMTDLPMHDRRLNVMSLENCACEVSKYIKAMENRGRPRSLYRGGI